MILSAASVRAQSSDQAFKARAQLLRTNTLKLDVTLQLDRDTYITGETAQMTVAIRNPTAQVLEVLEPFTLKTGGFALQFFAKRGRETTPSWHDLVEDPLFPVRAVEDVPGIPKTNDLLPSRFVQPGEVIQRKFFFSYDHHFEHNSAILDIPSYPGTYRFYYSHGSNGLEFH